MNINENVARGAAWLDAHVPGWFDRVDLDILNMTSSDLCIFGQVFDTGHDPDMETGFEVGMGRLMPSLGFERTWEPMTNRMFWELAEGHGLFLPLGDDDATLIPPWTEIIMARRSA